MARGVHGWKPQAGGGAWADQELLRLRHLHAYSGGRDLCARRAAGVCRGDSRYLQRPTRRAGTGAEQTGMASGAAEGDDVRVGEDSRAVQEIRVGGVFKAIASGGEG